MTPPQQNPNVASQQDMAVLDQVKKERGAPERMTTEQILQKAFAGTNQNPLQFQTALAQLVKTDPNFRVARSGNTLFMYYNKGNGHVEIMMETADKPKDLIAALADSVKAGKVAGFKTGAFDVDNPLILKALQMAGVKYTLQPGEGVMEDGQTPQQIAILEF